MKTVTMLTLLAALHAVESDSGTDPKCGGNEYQITRRCVDDVNRILKKHDADWRYKYADVKDPVKSRGIAIIYMNHYGNLYRKRTGLEPTAKTYALIFHLGYKGMLDRRNKARGDRYWRKVSRKLKEEEMRVIEIGNIAERATLDNIPKVGIIIEATVEELRKLPQCLYREVEITTKEEAK